jgi:hypothetical protein
MYQPLPVARDAAALPRYLEQEFRRIADTLANLEANYVLLRKLYVEPTRKRDGMVVYADGSEWDPGDGAGLYRYEGGAWIFIG